MRRFAATLAAGLILVALGGGSAFAQTPYPIPTSGSTSVSQATVEPGEPFTVSGSGWQPGSTVTLTLFSDPVRLGTATVDGSGSFSTQVSVPNSVTAGSHTLQVSGTGADGQPRTTSTRIVVVGAASASRGTGSGTSDLADTGVAVGRTVALATALLIVGVGALLVTRRNSRVRGRGAQVIR